MSKKQTTKSPEPNVAQDKKLEETLASDDGRNNQSNLPALSPPRLPYHPAIQKEFGVDIHGWKVLVEAIWPGAQNPASVRLALSYCKARKLDPFKRVVHIVPIWDSEKRCLVDTVWPGIAEVRTTAHRTGLYAGRDKTEFGPKIEREWNGTKIEFPEWAQVTVYRLVKGNRVAYAGPQVYWLETYASIKDGSPNSMWRKRPKGQLDKCAEAAALRAAFPEEVGNEYIDAEAHLSKHVESREVESGSEKGVNGLKERLAERDKAQAEGGNDEQPKEGQPEEQTQESPEPVNPDERSEEVNEKISEQKQKLQATGSIKGKSNLF